MPEIICIGNLNYDIIWKNAGFPGVHEKVSCEDVHTGLGGAAGNTAYWLARLGHRVGFVGSVGNDPMGRLHLAEFERWDIDISQITISEKNTGLAVIFSNGNDKRMVKSSGANRDVSLDEAYLQGARVLHISGSQKETAQRVIEIGKRNRIKVSYDPGAALYPDLFEFVDILILNEDEAKNATRSATIDQALSCLSSGVRIITKNSGGCVISENGKRIDIDSSGVSPLDTTGAGDAFDAGFLHGVLIGRSIGQCGRLGVAAATMKVSHYGARGGELTRDWLEDAVRGDSALPSHFNERNDSIR